MGAVLSVNLAEIRMLERRGHQLPTGIWKLPAAGRVPVRELGLEGDKQADRRVHGGYDKAVYAYAREDTDWWESELGRELEDGFFGENLTVSGIEVTGARPGDRWRVGTTLLEVTEPRLPCWKMEAKAGEPRFIKRFAQAGRPGAYLRVVDEGDIGAGDEIVVEPGVADRPTMGELAPGTLV